MFVYRVAGPSRVSVPSRIKLSGRAQLTCTEDIQRGCLVLGQRRHMARAREDPDVVGGTDTQGGKKRPPTIEQLKKQGQQMERMGRRTQERNPIDELPFPTLDVTLIEDYPFRKPLYFPYYPLNISTWPFWLNLKRRYNRDDIYGWFSDGWDGLKRPQETALRVMTRSIRAPGRAVRSLRAIRRKTNQAFAISAPPKERRSSPARVPGIAAPTVSADATAAPVVETSAVETLETQTTPHPLDKALPPPTESTASELDPNALAVINAASTSPSLVPRKRPSIFSKEYWRVFRGLLRQRYRKLKLIRRLSSLNATLRSFWPWFTSLPWRYLHPASWSSQGRRQIWRDVVAYMKEAERHGPAAREFYVAKLANEKANRLAVEYVASKNRFPEFVFPYASLANRSLRMFGRDNRFQRYWEDARFGDLSYRPQSPVYSILKDAMKVYRAMNLAVAEARRGDLRKYAGKRYLSQIERRAFEVDQESKRSEVSWEFVKWLKAPEVISIRAQDVLARYSQSYRHGDHMIINMIVKFESEQRLETTPKGANGVKLKPKVETRQVVEYLVLEFRTWVHKARPIFIQEVFPGQRLDVLVQDMDERKLRRGLKRAAKAEAAEGVVA